jgi:DNA-binding response OmpR family regulator
MIDRLNGHLHRCASSAELSNEQSPASSRDSLPILVAVMEARRCLHLQPYFWQAGGKRLPSGCPAANPIFAIFKRKTRGMYSGAQGDRQIPRNVHVPQGDSRTEIAPRPIIIIMSENVASLVAYILEDEGCLTMAANDILGGAVLAKMYQACLTILDTDVLDQKQSTEQALYPLLANANAPLLVLTADSERWSSLVTPSRAVKVVQKPLPTPALLTQIRAHMATTGRAGELHFADVTASLRTRGVRRGARRVHTSPTQFRMLCHLLRYPGQVVSREELIEAVWKGSTVIDQRTIDAHIVHLRKALTIGGERNVIQTVRSAGYLLDFDN